MMLVPRVNDDKDSIDGNERTWICILEYNTHVVGVIEQMCLMYKCIIDTNRISVLEREVRKKK